MRFWALRGFSGVMTRGRPPLRPRARAALTPSRTRWRMTADDELPYDLFIGLQRSWVELADGPIARFSHEQLLARQRGRGGPRWGRDGRGSALPTSPSIAGTGSGSYCRQLFRDNRRAPARSEYARRSLGRQLHRCGAGHGDSGPAAAPLDDNQNHGESYRLKTKRKAGELNAPVKEEEGKAA